MPPLTHWSCFAVPRLAAGAAVVLGILVLVLSNVILMQFAKLGAVLGLVLIVGGGLVLLFFAVEERFPK